MGRQSLLKLPTRTLDLTDEEKLAVVAELKRTINNDSLSAVASRPDAKGDPGEAPAAGRRHRRAASDSKARGSAPCGAGRHEAAPTRINSLSGAPMRLADPRVGMVAMSSGSARVWQLGSTGASRREKPAQSRL